MEQAKEKKIKILLFDLDNTLYASSAGILSEMDKRMYVWITEKVKMEGEDSLMPRLESMIPTEQSKAAMKGLSSMSERLAYVYWQKYGLSVNGLRKHHWNELTENETEKLTLEYLDYVHDVSKNLDKYMKKDVELKSLIKNIKSTNSESELQKWIFTNSYADHANRVLEYLEIKELFHGMVDYLIMRNDCKPLPSSYNLTLKMINQQFKKIPNNENHEHNKEDNNKVVVLPENCIFLDDSMSNLIAAKALGFYTVLIKEGIDNDSSKSLKPDQQQHVDFAFSNVVDCLKDSKFLTFFNLSIKS